MAALKRLYSIVLGGTSLTNGRLATSWDIDLQRALEQAVDRPVRIINLGKGSQSSTSWGVPTLATSIGHKPDLWLTEGYAINDCAMGVTRAQHNANLDTMISGMKAGSPNTRICLQTMSPASSGDALRGNLANYYADEVAKAVQWGVDCLQHHVDWPTPLPPALTQIDPTTGLPDGLHPNKAANRQYFFPKTVAYLIPLILSAP